jgi:hypothetical protein
MTRDEALDVVSMISSHWPGNQWVSSTLDAYARAIEWMDPVLATKAVMRAVQECEFYPKVAVLKEFYGIEKRLAEPEQPIERMLNDTPSRIMPQWIGGWIVSRVKHKDMRVWQEQTQHIAGEPMPQEARDAYIIEAAGLPIDELFRKITLGEA